jgi:hypothetical protein
MVLSFSSFPVVTVRILPQVFKMFQYLAQDLRFCPACMSHLLPLVAFSSLMKSCTDFAEAAVLLLNLNLYRAHTFFIPGERMGIFTHFSHL